MAAVPPLVAGPEPRRNSSHRQEQRPSRLALRARRPTRGHRGSSALRRDPVERRGRIRARPGRWQSPDVRSEELDPPGSVALERRLAGLVEAHVDDTAPRSERGECRHARLGRPTVPGWRFSRPAACASGSLLPPVAPAWAGLSWMASRAARCQQGEVSRAGFHGDRIDWVPLFMRGRFPRYWSGSAVRTQPVRDRRAPGGVGCR